MRRASGLGTRACRGTTQGPILVGPLVARYTDGMDTPEKRRWYRPTPGWLVCGSLAVTGLLFLSERWRWFPFNERKGWTVLAAVAGVGVVLMAMLLWWFVALVFRSRFQFSVRMLLMLVVAVALPFSWLATEVNKAKKQEAAAKGIAKVAAVDPFFIIVYDWQVTANDYPMLGSPRPRAPECLRNLLGDDFFADVFVVDFGHEHLDVPWGPIKCLGQLRYLNLGWTSTNDTDLEQLTELKQLQWLSLDLTGVTDAGLAHLGRLTQLQELRLDLTRVTDEGVEKLQQTLPNCKIKR